MIRQAFKSIASLLFLATALVGAQAQTASDPLMNGFQNPPDGARPRVWWHWMNGNITKEGIKLDLEWMHRVGLGGFQNFDAALANTPGCRQAAGLHDSRVEGCFQVRNYPRGSIRHGGGHRRIAGMERVWRSMGPGL